MNEFLINLRMEIALEERILAENQKLLRDAPPGALYVRQRERGETYYWQHKVKAGNSWKTVQENVTGNVRVIQQLASKRLAAEKVKACKNNLKTLIALKGTFSPHDSEFLKKKFEQPFKTAFTLQMQQQIEVWLSAPYEKCPFDPERHKQETAYGGFVRSKSEAIIANGLYAMGIPFHYEEKLLLPNGNGEFIYPDFTICIPEEVIEILRWEHLGMLDDEYYCIDNAKKLNAYQLNDITIGKNLILTQDDHKGNGQMVVTKPLKKPRNFSHGSLEHRQLCWCFFLLDFWVFLRVFLELHTLVKETNNCNGQGDKEYNH